MYDHLAKSCNTSVPYSADCAMAPPASPCLSAYNELSAAQHLQIDMLHKLHSVLQPVLRDNNVAKLGAAVNESPRPAPVSELHGQILSATERTDEATRLIGSLIERLTV